MFGTILGLVGVGMGVIGMVQQNKAEKKLEKQQKLQTIKNKAYMNKRNKTVEQVSSLDNKVEYSDSSSAMQNKNRAINETKRAYEKDLNQYEKKIQ